MSNRYSGGTNLDSIFEPRDGRGSAQSTGHFVGNQDLGDRYLAKNEGAGATASGTGIYVGGSDLNQYFTVLGDVGISVVSTQFIEIGRDYVSTYTNYSINPVVEENSIILVDWHTEYNSDREHSVRFVNGSTIEYKKEYYVTLSIQIVEFNKPVGKFTNNTRTYIDSTGTNFYHSNYDRDSHWTVFNGDILSLDTGGSEDDSVAVKRDSDDSTTLVNLTSGYPVDLGSFFIKYVPNLSVQRGYIYTSTYPIYINLSAPVDPNKSFVTHYNAGGGGQLRGGLISRISGDGTQVIIEQGPSSEEGSNKIGWEVVTAQNIKVHSVKSTMRFEVLSGAESVNFTDTSKVFCIVQNTRVSPTGSGWEAGYVGLSYFYKDTNNIGWTVERGYTGGDIFVHLQFVEFA